MPNPYHDKRTGEFTTKSGGGGYSTANVAEGQRKSKAAPRSGKSGKIIHTATTPDGSHTLTRKSDREYPFALAVHFAAQPERYDKYAKRTVPATKAHWKIMSFHGTHDAAVKGASPYKTADRFEVVPTERKHPS